jgi:ABC-type multidrug transport system ATPase subunit
MPSIARPNANAVSPEFARLPLDHSLTVGRQAIPGQVVLDHPNISLRHAALDVANGRVVLRDLGAANGTYVNGALLRGARSLVPGDRIVIGPFGFVFDGTALTGGWVSNVELLAQGISYDVPDRQDSGSLKRILDNASIHICPSEFVGIIGPNGSGKSTLMDILAGRTFPSKGSVRLNDIDLHLNFEVLKRDIAFLPQRDILHEQLTLRQSLGYTARLRLPPDTTRMQRREAVRNAARSVGLLDRLDQRMGALSGGQKKCACLASEILDRPGLLFLDEVTSGLDEDADWEIMRLLRHLSDEGMTIVVITHTLTSAAEFCDKVLCMGGNGQPTFFGTPAEALDFFAVSRLGDVLSRIDEFGAEHWRARFESRVDTSADPALPMESYTRPHRPEAHRRHEPSLVTVGRTLRQGAVLLQRNTRLLLSDRRTLVMAAVQSVLIGGLVGYAFGQFGSGQERVNAENALLLLLGLSAIWLGCNAASKEIVGDLAIYRREHDINLSTAAFIGAKFLVSAAFTLLQLAVVYVLVAVLAEKIPGDRLEQFLLLNIAALAGTAIGLVISAFANTRDQATTIVPLALVPQLVLAGVLVPKLPELATNVAKVAVSGFWITEAMKSVFIASEGPIRVIDAHTGMVINMTAQPVVLSAAIVATHALAFLALAYLVTLLRHGGLSLRPVSPMRWRGPTSPRPGTSGLDGGAALPATNG